MGILNVTPDSFSENGRNFDADTAVAAGLDMIAAGADIIDIGAESSRPGSEPVGEDEELRRVLPVIRGLRKRTTVPLSIDTTKSQVAKAAVENGADIINDISGFHCDATMRNVAADTSAGCILMHMRGTPQTMQDNVDYNDIVDELNQYFTESLAMLAAAGIDPTFVCLDPGIGFSKTAAQNRLLIKELNAFTNHGRPLLLGPSRKSFIGTTLGIESAHERIWGTAAAVALGIANGARIMRVHDVAEMRQVAEMTLAIVSPPRSE